MLGSVESISIYRCPKCHGYILDEEDKKHPLLKALFKQKILRKGDDGQYELTTKEKSFTVKEGDDFEVVINGDQVTVTRLTDEEPSMARIIHQNSHLVLL